MQKTTNYNLNQWEAHDPIRRADFNADNAAIDGALGTLAKASAGHGNCQIIYGTYLGTGSFGSENSNSLTFDRKPLFVAVLPDRSMGSAYQNLMMVYGSPVVYTFAGYPNSQCNVTWTDTSVSWYNNGAADYQFNTSGYTYCYVALLAADE